MKTPSPPQRLLTAIEELVHAENPAHPDDGFVEAWKCGARLRP